jgi:ribosomal protein S18 acetylase RimI-like enzyme
LTIWLLWTVMSAVDRPGYEIRRYAAADWRQVRDIRLEMLADTPLAYVEALADAQRYGDDEWRARAAWADEPNHLGLAGMLIDNGRWIALARGAVPCELDGHAFVFSVYVAPDFRGRGVADRLLDRVEEWARDEGNRALYLYVHQDNARAIAFYARRGYAFTGAGEPYKLDRSQLEREMRLPLR